MKQKIYSKIRSIFEIQKILRKSSDYFAVEDSSR